MCWEALRRRPQFVVESVGVVVFGCFVSAVIRWAVSAVATELGLHCVELSSGKCYVLVRHFQTAAFSVSGRSH